ncbi:hypothetical protein YB2330_000976 [Saitoella coloradoensis]
MTEQAILKIGYVPEHFSTPLLLASRHGMLPPHSLHPQPSGTGQMIESLRTGEIDIALGLTEGWVAGLGGDKDWYKIIGTYVQSPLCWAISTGAQSEYNSVDDLKDSKLGISRIGSGSYVMAYYLADTKGWLEEGKQPFDFQIQNTFLNLRNGVNSGASSAFMWEYFTSKKYYDNKEIRQIGEIYTPWPSWLITAHTSVLERPDASQTLSALLEGINKGVEYFHAHTDEVVEYISTELDYSAEDAKAWLKTVEYPKDVKSVDHKMIESTIGTLQKAGVIKGEPQADAMVQKL